MKKDDRVYLFHIRDALQRIVKYTRGGKKRFLKTHQIQDAVVRNFEIIGEAVKHLSPGLRASHREVPWKQIAGMRDKMIHEYFGVNLDLVWEVVADEVPTFQNKVLKILASLRPVQSVE